jgi:hypothetical protein
VVKPAGASVTDCCAITTTAAAIPMIEMKTLFLFVTDLLSFMFTIEVGLRRCGTWILFIPSDGGKYSRVSKNCPRNLSEALD